MDGENRSDFIRHISYDINKDIEIKPENFQKSYMIKKNR